MGLTTSEIAVNIIPCCCDTKGTDGGDYIDDYKEIEEEDIYDDNNSIGGSTINSIDNIDDFMEDPQNENTKSVINKMGWDILEATDDLWTVLDEIFFSYQPDKLRNAIQNEETGLKKGLQHILDSYTQESLFKSIKNYGLHQSKYKFDITKTMSIADYVSDAYKTETLWFYEDKNYGLISDKMECDEVYRYDYVDGNKYIDEKGEMECDNNIRHHNYPLERDRCLLHTQYISFGSIESNYYKTRINYKREDIHWCFKKDEYEYKEDINNNMNDMDYDCTLIAFSSFGQHYTSIYSYQKPQENTNNDYGSNTNNNFMRKKIEFLNSVRYISDVSYLKNYSVRSGYNKYGALAYFNSGQEVIAIQTYWDNRIWMKPNNLLDLEYLKQWKYAKWIWKISIIISSYITEWICKCRFREINSFILCIHKNLNMNHYIRRLFKPFIYGTISANNYFKLLCKKYGLFHRIFGFEYDSFCKLLNDSMKTYKFKILKKKFKKLRSIEQSLCPGYSDFLTFWNIINDFVTKYFEIYYGNGDNGDFLLMKDKKLRQFYIDLVKLLNIEKKYRYKRFNIIMLITHFICTVTIYNKHLNEPLSWDGLFKYKIFYPNECKNYLQQFIGCAIRNINNMNNPQENDILSYTEYMLLINNNGIKEKNFDLKNIWSLIVLKDDQQTRQKCIKLFHKTQINLNNLEKEIQLKNKQRRIPYNACCVSYLQSSACL